MGHKYCKLFIVACLIITGAFLFTNVQQSAADINNTFLGNDNGSNDMKLGVWTTGDLITLDSPKSKFRIFKRVSDGNGVVVQLVGICSTGRNLTITTPARIYHTPSDCEGNSVKFTMGGANFGPTPESDNWLDAPMTVRADSGQRDVAQHFNIIVTSNALITFDNLGLGDNNNSTTRAPLGHGERIGDTRCSNPTKPTLSIQEIRDTQNRCQYPDDNAFSVIPENGMQDRFRVVFSPSCNYDNDEPVYLKWFDGDHGTSYGGNVSWKLTDLKTGEVVARSTPDDIGGEGSFAFKNVGHLEYNHRYEWQWDNINTRNGVQIWMPFSEFNTRITCGWNLAGNSQIKKNSGTFTDNFTYSNPKVVRDRNTQVVFRHSIVNGGPADANYTWKILGCYEKASDAGNPCSNKANYRNGDIGHNKDNDAGGGNLPFNSVDNIGKGGRAPDGRLYQYQFPNGVGNNDGTNYASRDRDKYCQIIEYNNSRGAGTRDESSSIVCVKYDPTDTTTEETDWNCNGNAITVTGEPLQPGDGTTVTISVRRLSGTESPGPGHYTVPGVQNADFNYTQQSGNVYKYTFTIPANKLNTAKTYQVNWHDPDHNQCSSAFNVWKLPYFKATNGAIRTGGNFLSTAGGDSISPAENGLLIGWYNNQTAHNGSATNLSALASIAISGVASAQPYTGSGGGETRLTFANAGTNVRTNINTSSPRLGGAFLDANSNHFYDPEEPKPPRPPQALPIIGTFFKPVASPNQASGTYKFNSDDLYLLAEDISDDNGAGKNITIFVNGHDVRILSKTDTLGFANSSWDADKAPSFTLVVTGGNIYVDPAVTELNGVYVAKKTGGRGGAIYTCAAPGLGLSPYPINAFNAYQEDCGNQLNVYGAFVADKINLMRSYGTLKNQNEPAEVFRYTPLLYLGNPGVKPPGEGALKYQSITSLPPVL